MMKKRVILGVILVLILIAAFTLPAWIRTSAFPWYANQTVGKRVDTSFNNSFSAINQQLKPLGSVRDNLTHRRTRPVVLLTTITYD